MVTLPIASIVFEGDLRLGVLQAISIDRLYDLDTLAEYVVVLNGSDNAALRSDMDAALRATSKTFRDKITYLEWGDLLGDKPKVGYYDQQAIKLALGRYFDTPMFLMLDAKNHFVRPTSSTDFLVEGKPYSPLGNTSPYWRKYVDASMDAVGNIASDRSKMLPSITPYVLYTAEVAAVADLLEEKYSKPLPEALRAAGGTEFLLYYAHIAPRLSDLYGNRQLPVRTLFTSWPQDPEIVERIIREVGEKNIPMFGLHRKRIGQLTDSQRTLLDELWHQYLLSPWESSEWFLAD